MVEILHRRARKLGYLVLDENDAVILAKAGLGRSVVFSKGPRLDAMNAAEEFLSNEERTARVVEEHDKRVEGRARRHLRMIGVYVRKVGDHGYVVEGDGGKMLSEGIISLDELVDFSHERGDEIHAAYVAANAARNARIEAERIAREASPVAAEFDELEEVA